MCRARWCFGVRHVVFNLWRRCASCHGLTGVFNWKWRWVQVSTLLGTRGTIFLVHAIVTNLYFLSMAD